LIRTDHPGERPIGATFCMPFRLFIRINRGSTSII
jgi:hypothetical protein